VILAAAVAVAALALTGDDGPSTPSIDFTPQVDPPQPPPPEAQDPPEPDDRSAGELATGITERNASLLFAGGSRTVDPGLEPWRARVEELRPSYYRLSVDWSQLQPSPGRPASLAKTEDGCNRGAAPCGAYAGIRDQLRAVGTQQRRHGGWEVLVVLYGVPDWAARPGGGCERPDIGPRSRPITDEGMRGYRRLVRDLATLGEAEGVALRYWSPWNEPNQQFFISPQRATCDTTAPSLAPPIYTRFVRALRDELPEARLVLGEMAGVDGPTPRATGIGEFVRALPRDVACAATVWSQHAYAERSAVDAGLKGPVGQLQRALRRRACTRGKPIWVTETGVGGARAGSERDVSGGALRAGCRALHRQLRRWHRDKAVDAAFQYTVREDLAFPVGLADAGLTRGYPTFDLWKAWGAGERAPDDPPPSIRTCG
jgi:hypothetical protein